MDRWAYLSVEWGRSHGTSDDAAFYETLLFAGDHSFQQIRLRKIYVEMHSLDESKAALANALGMKEELRFSEQLVLDQLLVDVLHMSLACNEWALSRESLVNRIDLALVMGQARAP